MLLAFPVEEDMSASGSGWVGACNEIRKEKREKKGSKTQIFLFCYVDEAPDGDGAGTKSIVPAATSVPVFVADSDPASAIGGACDDGACFWNGSSGVEGPKVGTTGFS